MKKGLIIITILSMTSCVSLKNTFSFEDPYKYKTITTKKVDRYEELKENTKKDVEEIKDLKKSKVNITRSTNIYKVEFTKYEEEILALLKPTFSLVESDTEIIRQTKDAVIKLRLTKDENIKPMDFLVKVNEVLKKTKTKSYIIAVSRTINNWGK